MKADIPTVYFSPAVGDSRRSKLDRVQAVLDATGPEHRFRKGALVAVKVHWGEPGNADFLSPLYARTVVQRLKELGLKPFVTETNTLYRGARHNALDNLTSAARHGFTPETLGCPVLVADGLRGTDYREVPLTGGRTPTARVAAAIAEADGLVVLSHVKGHVVFGFGGALKHLGMGCSPSGSKQYLHADIQPVVDASRCTGCGVCVAHCRFDAITLDSVPSGRSAAIHLDRCTGCGECVGVCPETAIPISWAGDPAAAQEKTAEFAWASTQGKEGRCIFLNCLLNVTPDCDCYSWSDAPLVPDIGYVAGLDPVAVDQASLDLVAQAPSLRAETFGVRNRDHFAEAHDIDKTAILVYAEKLGMGTRRYAMKTLYPRRGGGE